MGADAARNYHGRTQSPQVGKRHERSGTVSFPNKRFRKQDQPKAQASSGASGVCTVSLRKSLLNSEEKQRVKTNSSPDQRRSLTPEKMEEDDISSVSSTPPSTPATSPKTPDGARLSKDLEDSLNNLACKTVGKEDSQLEGHAELLRSLNKYSVQYRKELAKIPSGWESP